MTGIIIAVALLTVGLTLLFAREKPQEAVINNVPRVSEIRICCADCAEREHRLINPPKTFLTTEGRCTCGSRSYVIASSMFGGYQSVARMPHARRRRMNRGLDC